MLLTGLAIPTEMIEVWNYLKAIQTIKFSLKHKQI